MEPTEPTVLDILEPAAGSESQSGEPPADGSLQLLPIWSRQIETSRQQTEEAIVALTARFSAIVQRIETALNTNGTGSQHDARAEAERSRSDLALVVDAL